MGVAKRVLVIFGAFIAACAAGSAILALLSFFLSPGVTPRNISQLPMVLLGAFFFVAVSSFLPALLVISFGEARGFTSLFFYLFSGAAIGAAVHLSIITYIMSAEIIWLYFRHMPVLALSLLSTTAMLAISGAVAGAAYWWIAGRNAGQWRETSESAKT